MSKAIIRIDIPTDYADEYKQWIIDGRLCYLEDGAWVHLKDVECKVEPFELAKKMRLIDVDKLLFSLEEWELNETPISTYPKPKEFTADDMQRMIWRTIRDCESAVEEQPTVDAEPVRHGYWVEAKYPLFTCSECGATYQDTGYGYNYCPNCGAKMDGERK